MQPKPSSLRAQAQLSETKTETMRTETVETFELVKVEQKLFKRGEERTRELVFNANRKPLTVFRQSETGPLARRDRQLLDCLGHKEQIKKALVFCLYTIYETEVLTIFPYFGPFALRIMLNIWTHDHLRTRQRGSGKDEREIVRIGRSIDTRLPRHMGGKRDDEGFVVIKGCSQTIRNRLQEKRLLSWQPVTGFRFCKSC
ncbi:hypothetical protein TNCV_1129481 [Trichonephila clavipes]|nr:hypothetical protein TNCV_1129481 [Trichonephila clavipes]